MTDTRKEFEDWHKQQWSFSEDKYLRGEFDLYYDARVQVDYEQWQAACQSLNDKRIQQLLAVIAKKDEALIKACELIDKFSLQVYNGSDCLMVYDAVELQPADVELVEVGFIKLKASPYYPEPDIGPHYSEYFEFCNDGDTGDDGVIVEPVYAIQRKDGKCLKHK